MHLTSLEEAKKQLNALKLAGYIFFIKKVKFIIVK